jgi:hypothetical protein
MFKNVEELQKFNKDQIAAVTAATTTFTKGFQQIAGEATEFSKKHFETSSATVQKLLATKSLDDAIKIQTEYAKSAYEGFVAQATKIGALYTDLAKEAFKPVAAVAAKAQAVAAPVVAKTAASK